MSDAATILLVDDDQRLRRKCRRLPTLLKPFRVEELVEASRLMRQRVVDLVSVALELQRRDRINRKR